MRKYIVLPFIIILSIPALAQTRPTARDSSVNMVMLNLTYTPQLPGADLADRFGFHTSAGFGAFFKTHTNWIFGGEFNFIFGGNVREDGVLDSIVSETGLLINFSGHMELVEYQKRGYSAFARAGKVFPLAFTNANSGLLFSGGLGFVQHRIHFNYAGGDVYQLEGDYSKGYDRLSNGIALQQTIGILHIDNKNLLNFFIGVDVIEGFTRNRRVWNFDTRERDDRQRLDLMFGLKASLIIPVFDKQPEREYIY